MRKIKKIQRLRHKILEASMTVEASYVVPLILGIIFAVMTMSFYLYDLNAAQAVVDKSSQKLINLAVHPYEAGSYFFDYASVNERFLCSFLETYEEKEEQEKEIVKENMEKLLILLKVKTVDVKIKKEKIVISAELCFRYAPYGFGFLPFFGKTKEIKTEKRIYHPADFVRILSVTEKISDKL